MTNFLNTDFHVHILPDIDDDGPNLIISLLMLRLERAQQITRIVASPHYYGNYSISEFIDNCNKSINKLIESKEEGSPIELFLGPEVYFNRELAKNKEICNLAIRGTKYILIEMPFRRWDKDEIKDFLSLRSLGLIPILVHPERYLGYQIKCVKREIEKEGILKQYNTSYFLNNPKRCKEILKGEVDIIGSDAHNISERNPNLFACEKMIEEKIGSEVLDEMQCIADQILKNAISVVI